MLSSGLSPDGFPFSRSIRPDGLSRFEFECVGNRYICAYISEGDKIISISVGGQSEDEVCLVSLLERFESASPANALRFAAIITGVTDLEFVRYLGDQWIPASSGDHLGYDHRYYVHLRLSSATPNEWTYTSLKAKSTDPDPIERSFQWIRLDPNNPPDLPEGLGHRLPDLLKSMEMDKESK